MRDKTATSAVRKRPRISDIAREAGVSVATVDRVLHGRPGVKKHTIDLINTVITQLEYGTPMSLARRPHRQLTFDVILPVGPNTYMDGLHEAAVSAFEDMSDLGVSMQVHRIDRFDPLVLTDHIRAIAPTTSGIAVVAIEHPMVREAVNEVVESGIPVVTLVSDLSTSHRTSYVGIDNRAAGRTAGALMGRLLSGGQGKIILLAGRFGLHYRDHEEREMGFQRILTEQFPGLQIAQKIESHDDFQESYRQTMNVLEREPDIRGIYNISGGNRGVGEALEETNKAGEIIFIGHELTRYSRQYLVSGTMDAVIDQSPRLEAKRIAESLYNFHNQSEFNPRLDPIPIQIFLRENLP